MRKLMLLVLALFLGLVIGCGDTYTGPKWEVTGDGNEFVYENTENDQDSENGDNSTGCSTCPEEEEEEEICYSEPSGTPIPCE